MRKYVLIVLSIFLFGCTTSVPPPVSKSESSSSAMSQDEILKILSDYVEVITRNSNELKGAGVFGNPENTLPYPKSTIREAILTSYAQSKKTEKDKETFGTAYMALGTFGTFANEAELKSEAQKWAFEWFQMTDGESK